MSKTIEQIIEMAVVFESDITDISPVFLERILGRGMDSRLLKPELSSVEQELRLTSNQALIRRLQYVQKHGSFCDLKYRVALRQELNVSKFKRV